jgi:hypothetical protein
MAAGIHGMPPKDLTSSVTGHCQLCSCATHPHCGFELNMGAGQQWVYRDASRAYAVAMHHHVDVMMTISLVTHPSKYSAAS